MSSRDLFASVLMAGLLAVGSLGMTPVADAASAGKSSVKPGKSAKNYVIKKKRRGYGPRIHLPIGPSYVYYDYPYYYSRGYYPTHIVHYIYYHPHYSYRSHHRGPKSLRRQRARRN